MSSSYSVYKYSATVRDSRRRISISTCAPHLNRNLNRTRKSKTPFDSIHTRGTKDTERRHSRLDKPKRPSSLVRYHRWYSKSRWSNERIEVLSQIDRGFSDNKSKVLRVGECDMMKLVSRALLSDNQSIMRLLGCWRPASLVYA